MGAVHRGDRGGEGPPPRRIVLDTDVFSYLIEERPEAARFRPLLVAPIAVAFPTVAELRFGAAKAGWGPARLRELEDELVGIRVLMPDSALIRLCGALRAEAWRLGHPLGHRANANDLWIATCAVHFGAPLLTGNLRHFEGIPHLTVLAPEAVR